MKKFVKLLELYQEDYLIKILKEKIPKINQELI